MVALKALFWHGPSHALTAVNLTGRKNSAPQKAREIDDHHLTGERSTRRLDVSRSSSSGGDAAQHFAARRIHPRDAREHHGRILLVAQYPRDGRGNIGRRQAARRDLIQERLEEVLVAAVDQRHVDRRAGERLCGGEPAEARANNHHARTRCDIDVQHPGASGFDRAQLRVRDRFGSLMPGP